jgi:hypothetical protein
MTNPDLVDFAWVAKDEFSDYLDEPMLALTDEMVWH